MPTCPRVPNPSPTPTREPLCWRKPTAGMRPATVPRMTANHTGRICIGICTTAIPSRRNISASRRITPRWRLPDTPTLCKTYLPIFITDLHKAVIDIATIPVTVGPSPPQQGSRSAWRQWRHSSANISASGLSSVFVPATIDESLTHSSQPNANCAASVYSLLSNSPRIDRRITESTASARLSLSSDSRIPFPIFCMSFEICC